MSCVHGGGGYVHEAVPGWMRWQAAMQRGRRGGRGLLLRQRSHGISNNKEH